MCIVYIRSKGKAKVLGEHGTVVLSYLVIDLETQDETYIPLLDMGLYCCDEGFQGPQLTIAGHIRDYKRQGKRFQCPRMHLEIFGWYLLLQS